MAKASSGANGGAKGGTRISVKTAVRPGSQIKAIHAKMGAIPGVNLPPFGAAPAPRVIPPMPMRGAPAPLPMPPMPPMPPPQGMQRPIAGGGKHPGFKAVAGKIGRSDGVPMDRARAILAASSRAASPAAMKANPRLGKVK